MSQIILKIKEDPYIVLILLCFVGHPVHKVPSLVIRLFGCLIYNAWGQGCLSIVFWFIMIYFQGQPIFEHFRPLSDFNLIVIICLCLNFRPLSDFNLIVIICLSLNFRPLSDFNSIVIICLWLNFRPLVTSIQQIMICLWLN